MIKVSAGILLEPQSLHQPARTIIGRGGKGDDLLQLERLEPEPQRLARRPTGQSPAPELPAKPPADLRAWREVGGEAGVFSPVNPAKIPSTSTAHSPQPRPSIARRWRSNEAADSSLVSSAGKWRITSGSAFIAAYGSKSESFHWRKMRCSMMSKQKQTTARWLG
jgi:hypothetical protein